MRALGPAGPLSTTGEPAQARIKRPTAPRARELYGNTIKYFKKLCKGFRRRSTWFPAWPTGRPAPAN